jgi:hypothetical protein
MLSPYTEQTIILPEQIDEQIDVYFVMYIYKLYHNIFKAPPTLLRGRYCLLV